MDDAEVVGERDGYWMVLSRDRRYFLRSAQFSCAEEPHVGQKGFLGYVSSRRRGCRSSPTRLRRVSRLRA